MGAQQLPSDLTNDLTMLLVPHMTSESARRTILLLAFGAGSPIMPQINFSAANDLTFTVNLINTLWSYGNVNNTPALEVLLVTIKRHYVSAARAPEIDDYIAQLHRYAAPQAVQRGTRRAPNPVVPIGFRVRLAVALARRYSRSIFAALILVGCVTVTFLSVPTLLDAARRLLTRTAPALTTFNQPTDMPTAAPNFAATNAVGTRSVLTLEGLRYSASLTAQIVPTLTAAERNAQGTRNAPMFSSPIVPTSTPFVFPTLTAAPTLTPFPPAILEQVPRIPTNTPFYSMVTVDTWTGRRANQYCSQSVETIQVLSSVIPPECDANTIQPQIIISFPYNGSIVEGVVPIIGTVSAPDLAYYRLEIANWINPTVFQAVTLEQYNPIQNGTFANLNTLLYPNGNYMLRLFVMSRSNGYAYRMVNLTISNRPPTFIPPPLPTDTAIFPPTDTPIFIPYTPVPFDAFPSPTATIAFFKRRMKD